MQFDEFLYSIYNVQCDSNVQVILKILLFFISSTGSRKKFAMYMYIDETRDLDYKK